MIVRWLRRTAMAGGTAYFQGARQASVAGRRLRQFLAATMLLAATACSTADYGKPVNDFAAATGEATTVLSELNIQLADGYAGVLENSVLKRRGLARAKAGECLAGASTRCRVEIVTTDGQTRPYPPEPPLARMSLLMAQINRYAANLKALLEADTARQAEGHVNAALGSVQSLAQTVVEAGGAGTGASVPQFATSAGAAVNWVVGQYVESVKYEGLQRATAAAKPVIRDAANLFSATAASTGELVVRSDLAEATSLAKDALAADNSKASLAAFAQSAATYDAFLTSGPQQMFQRMAAAHDALAESLQNEDVTFVTAVARIEAFAAEAKKLATILKDLRAVVPAKPGG